MGRDDSISPALYCERPLGRATGYLKSSSHNCPHCGRQALAPIRQLMEFEKQTARCQADLCRTQPSNLCLQPSGNRRAIMSAAAESAR